jgi:hypothetical protein
MRDRLFQPRFALLYLLLLTDLAFIVLYGLYGFKFITDPKFGLIEDWSYGEVFQYIKEFWIFALLAFLAIRRRSWLFGSWALLFLYLMLDDSMQIHERMGEWVAATLRFVPMFGLRSVDFGELAVSGIAGVFFLVTLSLTYIFAEQQARAVARGLFFMLLALVFFGVVVDMLVIDVHWLLTKAIGALEDGGEQVVMSFITWYVFTNASSAASSKEVTVA